MAGESGRHLHRDETRKLCRRRFRFRSTDRLALGDLLKLSARAFDLPGGRFSGHSLRSGGAASLFVSGVSLQDIRRFGRWRSATFHEYLWFVDPQYRHLSDLAVNSAGLTDQLRLESRSTTKIRFPNLFLWSRKRAERDAVRNLW